MARTARGGRGRWLAAVVGFLVIIGTLAGAARAVYPHSLAARAELIRTKVWREIHLQDAGAEQRGVQVRALEARYTEHPLWIFLHASVGAVFLIAAATQFSSRWRTRYLQVHRWMGRGLFVTGMLIAGTGMYFGVVVPAAGLPEAIVIGGVGFLFVLSLVKGALAIRRKELTRHGEWMTRAFAVALGTATIRLVAIVADAALTPRGWALQDVFVLSLVLGWVITSTGAELWIRLRREHPPVSTALKANASVA